MAKVLSIGHEEPVSTERRIPHFLQREETAAQIVALMQARFDRPGPEEMLQVLKCAEQQIIGSQP